MDARQNPVTGSLLAAWLLTFAGGLICGVVLAAALRPVRVVRFWSVPLDAPACDPAAAIKEGMH